MSGVTGLRNVEEENDIDERCQRLKLEEILTSTLTRDAVESELMVESTEVIEDKSRKTSCVPFCRVLQSQQFQDVSQDYAPCKHMAHS
jgi:hypothetical protein